MVLISCAVKNLRTDYSLTSKKDCLCSCGIDFSFLSIYFIRSNDQEGAVAKKRPVLHSAVSVDFLCSICYNSDIERSYDGKHMEWFWYIIASVSADIGTGFSGLSAATVMVPMPIVLCPFFSGETGAHQATVIALASDIPAVRGRRTAHEAASL